MRMGVHHKLPYREEKQQRPGVNNMVRILFQVSKLLTAAAKIGFFSYESVLVAT